MEHDYGLNIEFYLHGKQDDEYSTTLYAKVVSYGDGSNDEDVGRIGGEITIELFWAERIQADGRDVIEEVDAISSAMEACVPCLYDQNFLKPELNSGSQNIAVVASAFVYPTVMSHYTGFDALRKLAKIVAPYCDIIAFATEEKGPGGGELQYLEADGDGRMRRSLLKYNGHLSTLGCREASRHCHWAPLQVFLSSRLKPKYLF